MKDPYEYFDRINLFVRDRIREDQAQRQALTACAILERFKRQPGVILADEVGMGKTFVALAVATSVAAADRKKRPVVVMVPPSLREKWPRDFAVFREKCLPCDVAETFRAASANRAVEFLKLLDDPPGRRKSIIFLTHGAMSRQLRDGWVKLALIQKALRHRRGVKRHRRALCRVVGDLLQMKWVDKRSPDVWEELIVKDPKFWLEILRAHGIDPEHDQNPDTDDDPVPATVRKALRRLDAGALYDALCQIPFRRSKNFDRHLKMARAALNEEVGILWSDCVRSLRFSLPLLILDEAHHLKNPRTRLASLFQDPDAHDDIQEISRGPLGGVFERMLFLTATPFQLGHYELCSVLERFGGISWGGHRAPTTTREGFEDTIRDLRIRLDAAQEAAVRLDHAWGLLRPEHLVRDDDRYNDIGSWWRDIQSSSTTAPEAHYAIKRYEQTQDAMRRAEEALSPWVIRHLRPRRLPMPHADKCRRQNLVGKALIDGSGDGEPDGISVTGEALLPFLLAARVTTCMPECRPVFAEGLASSFEAFLHTRKQRERRSLNEEDSSSTDHDDEPVEIPTVQNVGRWYLDELQAALPLTKPGEESTHPKINATIDCALDLWRRGEKVLIFCHYIATGRALRQRISKAINDEVTEVGSRKLGCAADDVLTELDRIGDRFFDLDSPTRKACNAEVTLILKEYPSLEPHHEDLLGIVRRYIRTPSFLVRYFGLAGGQIHVGSLAEAFDNKDASGLTLRQLLRDFFEFLEKHSGADERKNYIDALIAIQTGSFFGADVVRTFSEDEIQGDRTERLIPNVRLVNGGTKQPSRQRLMLTFNTPFFPEILIASSVMAEGVDLHLNCRYIIHHDLCWNPSTLEQRTGRIDRIGAKVEKCGEPIHVYLPYIAETQDEKMYRVVTDRERWFKVVMGEQYKVDARTAEKLAERLTFPESAAEALAFRLGVVD